MVDRYLDDFFDLIPIYAIYQKAGILFLSWFICGLKDGVGVDRALIRIVLPQCGHRGVFIERIPFSKRHCGTKIFAANSKLLAARA